MEYVNARLYEELSGFNSFVVNGFICENGAFSALVSDKPRHCCDNIMFQYGYSNIISLTDGLSAIFGSQAWDIDRFVSVKGNDYTDYTIIYSNGQKSQIRAYNRELPNEVKTDTLIDVRLIDDRYTNIYVDGNNTTVCVVLDVNRVKAKIKENAKIYEYICKNIPINFMQLELDDKKMRLAPCAMVINDSTML